MSTFYMNQRLTHMSKSDSYLWSKFLDLLGHKYKNFKYDVRVGSGVTLPQAAPDWLQKAASALSKKRIDVVMEDTKNIYVVECRLDASAAAIGQLISYVYLYRIRFNPTKPVKPFLISNSFDADLLIALNELRIQYMKV